jgi:flavin reductase (DIM6/NTAB) family NADH-FMN oxidoreductase RutF
MFYDGLKNDHGLPHDPLKQLVAPRPIGWISTCNVDGARNLAPYSYFNLVGDKPGIVMFSSVTRKHTLANIEATGEFVCNLATWDLREAVNRTSAPVAGEVDEFELARLTPAPSRMVAPPRVAESPVALECTSFQILDLPDGQGGEHPAKVCFGLVVGVHIDDRAIVDGRVDATILRPIARLGYMDYAVVEKVFAMERPTR